MNPSFFAKVFGLFIVGLVVVFVIDPIDTSTVSTPFCLGIIMMGLSLRQSTSVVAVTSIIYLLLTLYALVSFHQSLIASGHVVGPHPYFWLFQRIGLFAVLCGLAVYLAYYRTASQKVLSHLQNILARLPVPVLISDGAGFVVYANEALTTAFKKDLRALEEKRYVDIFMSDIQEGKAIRYYIELFGAKEGVVHELELKPFDNPAKIKARLTCLGAGPNRVLVTVFSTEAEMAQSLSLAKA
jgi:PAS domain-containing protein